MPVGSNPRPPRVSANDRQTSSPIVNVSYPSIRNCPTHHPLLYYSCVYKLPGWWLLLRRCCCCRRRDGHSRAIFGCDTHMVTPALLFSLASIHFNAHPIPVTMAYYLNDHNALHCQFIVLSIAIHIVNYIAPSDKTHGSEAKPVSDTLQLLC